MRPRHHYFTGMLEREVMPDMSEHASPYNPSPLGP